MNNFESHRRHAEFKDAVSIAQREREPKRLTQKEAAKLLDRAYALNRQYPQQRVGQNLWNFIQEDHPDLAAVHVGLDNDFFYQRHVPTVIETFYRYYVEK